MIPIDSHAKTAQRELAKLGGTIKLTEYAGGHGWHGDVFGNINNGVTWLEENTR